MTARPRGLAAVVAGAALIAIGFVFRYPELAVLGAAAIVASVLRDRLRRVAPRVDGPAQRRPRPGEPGRAVHPHADRPTGGRGCGRQPWSPRTGAAGCRWRYRWSGCGRGTTPTCDYPVPTARRGVVEIGPLTVARTDPLALAGTSRRYGGTVRVWVHPRISSARRGTGRDRAQPRRPHRPGTARQHHVRRVARIRAR